jgi:ribose transport system substrate-binding protein
MILVVGIGLFSAMCILASGQQSDAADKKSIYWIGKTLNNPWWVMVKDIAVREAAELGVDITTNMPEEEVDIVKQVRMIETAIEEKADAIVVSAIHSRGVIPVLQRAKEAGIPIINFDTRIADPTIAKAFVGADDVAGAYKAGKYICEKLGGKGEVALLEGLLEQSTGVDRRAGFLKAIEEYPDIKLVASFPAAWRTELALDATVYMLASHPEIDAIFACNDQMAIGMVSGVYAAGRDPKELILVGYDGILEAARMVLEGDLDAFVALPTREEGRMGMRLAVTSLLHPEFEFPREIIFPGPCVAKEFEKGLTDETIFEYISRVFPLMGVTETGY